MRSPYTRTDLSPNQEHQPDSLKAVSKEHYDRCQYCGSRLIFSHQLNLGYLEVIETGQCPGCGVSNHPKRFTLQ